MPCLTSLEAFRVLRSNSARFVDFAESIPMQCLPSLETFMVSRLSPNKARIVDQVVNENHIAH